ncbi:hypothetical protein H9L10_09755 [Phycicoccus endophyticus]|uniref:Uncharacterized protein n=1 Tax=Phycicoccus endophyticus TaxID=1690220 RepID=A0A7G9QZ26_9MICO|nr:hypothetical protein [Phycicoccus endophyticus]NHI18942.1 hypothetical protein [Phycicoccus endophyticus]QNN48601.1 hypothetical protein H9L10_09755 [Phycicoccus endophyticus]GGL31565.1 hypothetical protein GCM10012283_12390 [Phycicoccus endophyticus]
MSTVAVDGGPVVREPWAHAVGRYAAEVLALVGVGIVLNVVTSAVIGPWGWGSLVAFSLLAGGVNAGTEAGSPRGRYRRRRMLPIVASAFALYLLVGVSGRGADLGRLPSGALAAGAGTGIIAVSVVVTLRLARDIGTRPARSGS